MKLVGNNEMQNIFKCFLPQQNELWKILEKVFITKKFTHCKTSLALKIDAFEITDNKNIGTVFS